MKRLIIFDMDGAGEKLIPVKKDDFLFSARPEVHSCVGCFGCWIRTPGACVISDRCEMIPREISECDELWYFGDSVSEGMRNEICYATEHGIPVRFVPSHYYESYLERSNTYEEIL